MLQQNAPRKREFRNNRTELWEFLRLSAGCPLLGCPGEMYPQTGRQPSTDYCGTQTLEVPVPDRLGLVFAIDCGRK